MTLFACGGGGGGGLPDEAPADVAGPVVLSIVPKLNEIDVEAGFINATTASAITSITVTFDELINRESLLLSNVIIQGIDNAGNVDPTVTVSVIDISFIDVTKKLTITTESSTKGGFLNNREYQIQIKNILDKLGNNMEVFTSRFSTTRLPVVTTITPANNTNPVSLSQVITIKFDEVMNEESLKTGFTLTETFANSASGTLYKFTDPKPSLKLVHQIVDNKSIAVYSLVEAGTNVAKLLSKTARYTVNLLPTAKDLKGNSVTAMTSSFTTGVSSQIGSPALKPDLVTAQTTNGAGGILENIISWSAKVNTAYILYVSKNSGAFTQIITTPTPYFQTPFVAGNISYIDKNVISGSSYEYAITAVDIISSGVYGAESVFSKSQLIIAGAAAPNKLTAIAAPDSGGTLTNGAVQLTWDSIANNKYNIYVSINGSTLSILQGNIVATGTTTTYSYSPGLNQRYIYAVSVLNQANVESVKVKSLEVVPFGPPTTVTTKGGDQQVDVTWGVWDKVPNLTYTVSVKEGADPNFNVIATGLVNGRLVHGVDTSLPLVNGTAYTYRVFATSTVSGVTRTSKGKDSIATLAVAPPPPPAPPNVINATANDSSITLNWSLEPATGASYDYNIYQKDSTAINFKLVKILTSPSQGTVTIPAANNITYEYQIAAVNSGVEGARSAAIALTPRLTPNKISSWNHSCVIKAGEMWCWGDNTYGQLGIGTKTFAEKQQLVNQPLDANNVVVGSSWIAVAAGEKHTCGIRNTGEMFCWGLGSRGQLGDGLQLSSLKPVLVLKPSALAANTSVNWSQVSAGRDYTCGIHRDANTTGQLFCWGTDDSYTLGVQQQATRQFTVNQPEPVLLGTADLSNNWVEIRASLRHTCGIRQQTAGSTLWCWGYRRSGQAGDSTSTLSDYLFEPTAVMSTSGGAIPETDWSSVALGKDHTCAVRGILKTVWCWGADGFGQLGNSDRSYTRLFTPTQVSPISQNWLKIFANNNRTCALDVSSAISCWGDNVSGGVGNGKLAFDVSSPTRIASVANWETLAIGIENTCAISTVNSISVNEVFCWGNAEKFGLGGTTSEKFIPTQVGIDLDWMDITAGSSTRANNAFTLGLRTSAGKNTMYGWGTNRGRSLPAGQDRLIKEQFPLIDISGFSWQEISAGEFHACGIVKTDSTLYCWGTTTFIGAISGSTSTPIQVGTETWLAVDAGENHSCGIKLVDSSLWCWGTGKEGELGAGPAKDANGNILVDSNGKVIAKIPDTANNEILIQVLEPSPDPDNTIATEWSSVSIGSGFACAIDSLSDLYCWGLNSTGQLGIGINTDVTDANGVVTVNTNKFVPTKVVYPVGVVSWLKVSVGYRTACALSTANDLYCWGSNFYGSLGNNGGSADQLSPSIVANSDLVPWADININVNHACARKQDNASIDSGALWCWGKNDFGQIGNGSFSDSKRLGQFVPVQVLGNKLWKKFTTGLDSTCAIASDNSLWCWGRNFDGELGINTSWKTRPISLTFP